MLDENFSIKTANDGEYWDGDLDRFIEMYESGAFFLHWQALVAINALSDESRIAMWCRSGVVPMGH